MAAVTSESVGFLDRAFVRHKAGRSLTKDGGAQEQWFYAESKAHAGGECSDNREWFLTTVCTTDPLVIVVPAMVVRSPAWTEYE